MVKNNLLKKIAISGSLALSLSGIGMIGAGIKYDNSKISKLGCISLLASVPFDYYVVRRVKENEN